MSWFVVGHLGGRAVGCFSSRAQRCFRTGYELRPVDVDDLAQLDLLPTGTTRPSR